MAAPVECNSSESAANVQISRSRARSLLYGLRFRAITGDTVSLGACGDIGSTNTLYDIPLNEPDLTEDVIAEEQAYLQRRWHANYHEAAIYLQEGENNTKFDTHPTSRKALPAYLIVHTTWFHLLDMFASVTLMALALCEEPAVKLFEAPVWIHASVELLCLMIISLELLMKLQWLGLKQFFSHKRTLIKFLTLAIMIAEAIAVLIRQENHFRVTRALRPIFLIDTHYCGGVRRFIRQILQSVPPILDMLVLLMFFILVFSVLGYYLFYNIPGNIYFDTFQDSFVSLFVLMTTANYPDVMMPAYNKYRWAPSFFILYLIIELYFLMNLVLAVVYDSFTIMEKEKFCKLTLHKRVACQHAFKLLVTKNHPNKISLRHFMGLMKYYRPHKSKRDVYLTFKTLNTSKTGFLSLDEFADVIDCAAYNWRVKKEQDKWFETLCNPFDKLFLGIHWLVHWRWFDYIVNSIIGANAIWLIVETTRFSNAQNSSSQSYREWADATFWVSVAFVSFYCLETWLKIAALGPRGYFFNGWNLFDFLVTIGAVVGCFTEYITTHFSFAIAVRPIRLLRIFRLKARYRDVFGTLFVLLPRLFSVGIVLLILYYFFAVVGMEMFADVELRNCCKGTPVEAFYTTANDSIYYYYLNTFDNILMSGVTLFELTIVNNWFIIMEGHAFTYSMWSRIYFMIFYLATMVVMTIVVAFILEAFLFRIQCRRTVGVDHFEEYKVKQETILTLSELELCYSRTRSIIHLTPIYSGFQEQQDSSVYIGERMKTKHDLYMHMYRDDVQSWLEMAHAEFRTSCSASSDSELLDCSEMENFDEQLLVD